MEKQIEIIESLGWRAVVGDDYVEIEQHSPLGEDLIFTLAKNDLATSANELADGFSVDDHAAELIPMRGAYGVPESTSELVKDAEAIQEILNELADKLN